MPTYVYQCKECGIQFERVQHFSEEPVKICPECSGTVQRVICPVGIIFKGSGWYVTDSAKAKSSTLPARETNGKDSESRDTTTQGDGAAAKGAGKPAAKPDGSTGHTD